ncbi:Phytosulfokines 3 [Morus notabilis]|uniref:Phytosulfokine n=1 Tax=Morus notabilis TaxID=981085 RepID=W9RP44_9ROSA|nr:phytosulfokines 3 [Morus notabilis]EXB63115.1 Phytosulfokines 3 [Morus notabilis]
MAKFITFFMLTILLSSALVFAGRPYPAFNPRITGQQQNIEAKKVEDDQCEGVGKEECLMRRTLVAHLDYIYTQEQKP